MAERLKGKVAVITGATSGIGEATAELFAREGARVVVSGRSEERGRGVAERIGEAAAFIRCDVREVPQIEALIRESAERFGRIDCLFNNAGGPTEPGGVEEISEAGVQDAVQLLVTSVLFGMKFVAPIMREQGGGGAIINNSSVASFQTGLGGYLYAGAKAAVTQYSQMAGRELAPHGITVNVISPGGIATPIFYGGSSRADQLDEAENERKMTKLRGNLTKAVLNCTHPVAEGWGYFSSTG